MTDNALDNLWDASQKVSASDDAVRTIATLIAQEREAVADLATAEAMAEEAKARRTELRNKRIPAAMLDAGMREFTTTDGLKAKIVFITDGSLGSPKTDEERRAKEAKLDCLIEHGGGEIVKQTVTLEFPKEMVEEAEAFRAWCEREMEKRKWNVSVSRERSVNHQTMGSWIRERMASGDAEDQLPPAFFEKMGLWYGEAAKITEPKKPKGAA